MLNSRRWSRLVRDLKDCYGTCTRVDCCDFVEAKQHFDEIALPALLVYKDSKLVNVYLRMVDSVGFNFDMDDVEEFLIE